jgi:hypothetical protein
VWQGHGTASPGLQLARVRVCPVQEEVRASYSSLPLGMPQHQPLSCEDKQRFSRCPQPAWEQVSAGSCVSGGTAWGDKRSLNTHCSPPSQWLGSSNK